MTVKIFIHITLCTGAFGLPHFHAKLSLAIILDTSNTYHHDNYFIKKPGNHIVSTVAYNVSPALEEH